MATIEKRTGKDGDASYRVKVRLRGCPVQCASFAKLTDAKRWGQQTETAIREGRYFQTLEGRKHTLTDAIERYEAEGMAHMRTREDVRSRLVWWKAELGHVLIADVTPAAVRKSLERFASEPSRWGRSRGASTVNHMRQALAGVLTLAWREWEWIETNPMPRVRKKAEPKGRVRFLSDDERKRLLAACRGSSNADLYPAVLLALTTGGRQGETMGATWKQVDLSRATLTLETTKNGTRRTLHLVGPVLELLRTRPRRLHTDLIFPSRNTRKPVDLTAPWRTALKRAGIGDFHWHDLRHTFASYAAMNGATLPELAALMGHKTLQMVQRYAHLSQSHTARVAERVAVGLVE